MATKRAARRSCTYRRAYRPLVKSDVASIARMHERHERYDEYTRGGYYAAAALVGLFLFLSAGVVLFQW